MADKTNLVEAIDHKNPPKPLPQKAGETKPAAHPAFHGERPEVLDHKNPPKPLAAKPGGSPPGPAAKAALILLFAWLSLLPAFAGLGVTVTNNLTVPLSVGFYTNAPALVISGLTSVGTNASTLVTNSSGSWSGLILVNTNNNAAVTVAFTAGASTNTYFSFLHNIGKSVYYSPVTTTVGIITNGSGGGGGTAQPLPSAVSVWGGTNNPNGLITSGYGSLYNQFDATTGTNFVQQWVKQSATGSTNWVVVMGGTSTSSVTNNGQAVLNGLSGSAGTTNVLTITPSTSTVNAIQVNALGTGLPAFTVSPLGAVTAPSMADTKGTIPASTNIATSTSVAAAGYQTAANVGALIFTSAPALTSPYVNSFVASNNIIDQKAIQDLSGYFAYLNKQGIASNLVDALALRQRWHPDVSLTSVKGNSFTWPNPSYEPGGYAQINAGSTITYQLPTLLSNFTVVITYHRPAGGTHNKSGTLFRFSDTNTYSSFYVSEVNGQHWCMENNGTNFYPPFNYTLAYNGTNYGTNTFYPPWIEGYANLGAENGRENPRMCERRAITLVHMANGTEFSYQDGLTNGYSYFGTWGSNFKYQSPTVSPVPFNTLTIGQEVTNTVQRMNYFSPYDDYTNFAVSSIQIFNSTNLNQIWPETEASWWFEDEDYYDQFVGDSRQQPIISPTTNSYPFFYEYGRSGGTYWGYANYSQGGTTAQQYETTWAAAGGIGTITNLPPEKIKKIDLWYRFGDNDIRNGATVANAYSYISNGVAQVLGTARPVTVHFMDGWQFSTNVGSFSLAYETNVLALNNMVATNQPPLPVQFHQLYPYITQNLLNTNNGYSGEGIHFNTTNTVVYKAIASWMLTGVWNASFLPAFQSIPH